MSNNTACERETFVTHLECSDTGKYYPANQIHGLSDTGRPLLVKYDLDRIAQVVNKEDLNLRDKDIWRYRELLPVRQSKNIVTLGENETPLLPLHNVQQSLGVANNTIWVKDEGRLPTGSFKARDGILIQKLKKGEWQLYCALLIKDTICWLP